MDFMTGLTAFLDWIEGNLINGVGAWFFNIFKGIAFNLADMKPFLDALLGFFTALN